MLLIADLHAVHELYTAKDELRKARPSHKANPNDFCELENGTIHGADVKAEGLALMNEMDLNSKAMEHVWRYFELHANQRMAVFNFFLVLGGIVSAALATAIQGSPRLAVLGIALGLLLALISFVFWKLDERVSFLIKHAEYAIAALEPVFPLEKSRLFLNEPKLTREACSHRKDPWRRLWTYGQAFRVTFCVIGAFGVGGTVLSAMRFAGLVSW